MSFIREAQYSGSQYEVSFDPSMGLPPIALNERQLLKLNGWREQSLLSFYNSAVKSPYTHIANNVQQFSIQYIGFGHVFRNRPGKNQLKNKDLLELMKRQPKEDSQIMAQLDEWFGVCHHCKQLLPNAVLKGCRYRSSRGAIASVESDNLLLELSDSEESTSLFQQPLSATSRGARKKTSGATYLSYTKKGKTDTDLG